MSSLISLTNSVVLVAALLTHSVCAQTSTEPTVTIANGVVRGTQAAGVVNKFLGLPYAAPPQRFSPPQAAQNFTGVYDASSLRSGCLQQFDGPAFVQNYVKSIFNIEPPSVPDSEDCLYVNVWSPSTPAPAGGRPVLFWIYGGSLEFGNAGLGIYDGSKFAYTEEVVFVSFNYRMSVFGFTPSPELPLAERNLGFLDQRFALDWVQKNIAAFGGNPAAVTIVGESAGAYSVDALITSYSPSDAVPFRGAIMQSGTFTYDSSPTRDETSPTTASTWDQLASMFNCTGSKLACLRAANATTILQVVADQNFDFEPTRDNVTAVSDPVARRRANRVARVPNLQGSNANEGRVFGFGQLNFTDYAVQLFPNSTSQVQRILAAYPLGPSLPTEYDQVSASITDADFQCNCALTANLSANAGIPTWRYLYNATFDNLQSARSFGLNLGAYHSSEIRSTFGTYPTANLTTQQYALSQSMMSAWGRFVRNPLGGPGWNALGTGMNGSVLLATGGPASGGVLGAANGSTLLGSYDVGLFGNVGNVLSGGVTVIPQSQIDFNCGLYASLYADNP